MLGANPTGGFSKPPAGDLLCFAFKKTELAYDGQPGKAWAQTHTSAVRFRAKSDEIDPVLTGIEFVEDDEDLRIEVRFAEPLAAYAGSGKVLVDDTVFDLRNYSFMLGASMSDLSNKELEGAISVLSGASIADMASRLQPLREFQFDGTSRGAYVVASGGDLKTYPGAAVAIEVDPDAPNTVNIWFRKGARDDLFKGFLAIKARVEGVRDPAGNGINPADADKNLVSQTL
jgi:hypothetical protein